MELVSNDFVSIVYHISVALVPTQYFFLMGFIYLMKKTVYYVLGIKVTVLILRVFHMTKRAHPCCLHLEDSEPTFLMVGSEYTIL